MVAGFFESLGETAYKEVYNAAAKTSLQYVLVAIKLQVVWKVTISLQTFGSY